MNDFIDDNTIESILQRATDPDPKQVLDTIDKALELQGLSPEEAAVLLQTKDDELLAAIRGAARRIKEAIYGNRLVLFAPLYIANHCSNNCLYCGFRRDNRELKRVALTMEQVEREVRILEQEGHRRLLMLCGEEQSSSSLDYFIEAVETAYATTTEDGGGIRRINAEVAPLEQEGYRRLKQAGIGTYLLFQETYHHETYRTMHPAGPKGNYLRRLTAMHHAQEAGLDDVGIGALFGLYDYRFDVLGLLLHARQLEKDCGVGPHTISIPRLEPAFNAPAAIRPPRPVSDGDFMTLVAVLRMAVPYTGIILTTRENASLRSELFSLGVSQVSAGSRTDPGGYSERGSDGFRAAQFNLGDTRTLDEVIRDMTRQGHIPSFCTACYRLGRTGKGFMSLAKPGLIQQFCDANAILSFKEYLLDYAGPETRVEGEALIQQMLEGPLTQRQSDTLSTRLAHIAEGARDVCI